MDISCNSQAPLLAVRSINVLLGSQLQSKMIHGSPILHVTHNSRWSVAFIIPFVFLNLTVVISKQFQISTNPALFITRAINLSFSLSIASHVFQRYLFGIQMELRIGTLSPSEMSSIVCIKINCSFPFIASLYLNFSGK